MTPEELRRLATEIYIIVGWGLGKRSASPSSALSAQIIDKHWTDTKLDGGAYHVGSTLDRIAPHLDRAARVRLVTICHRHLHKLVGSTLTAQTAPPELKSYLR